MIASLRTMAGQAVVATSFAVKGEVLARLSAEVAQLVDECHAAGQDPSVVVVDGADAAIELCDVTAVGLPDNVELVAPKHLARRSWGTERGRGATLHALAHIEANAVNLALDAVHRFGGMPLGYYRDWIDVASEELGHFHLLGERLADYGLAYGDLPCHGGLWDVATKTTDSVLRRMALVPMVFEARGLDVTPGIVERFERHGDTASAEALGVVLRDEIGHVDVGVRWFTAACELDQLDMWETFERLVDEAGLMIVPPLNVDARTRSGFPAELLDTWTEAFLGRSGNEA